MSPMRNLLLDAMHEIRALRRQNEILSAKVEMIDLFACVLHTEPARRSQGAAPDVARALEKEAARLETEEQAPAQQSDTAGSGAIHGGRTDDLRPGNQRTAG
jgi:hypothetical protein